MTIKEVSETYGLSQDTLRYYERVGMIPRVTRSQSGHRDYQEKDLGWVELAKCLRNAGLTVEAIVEYVRLSLEGDYHTPEVRAFKAAAGGACGAAAAYGRGHRTAGA